MVSNALKINKIKLGRAERYSFAKTKIPIEVPNLLDVQKKSYADFLSKQIWNVINEFNPIVDYANKAELSFLDYSVDLSPKYSWEECKRRQSTYSVPLKVKARLLVKETGEVSEQEVYLGDIPYMSDEGGFIFNGIERVVISQLAKAPGIYFDGEMNKYGRVDYNSVISPVHGMWIATEQVQGEQLRVILERKHKLSLGVFLKCFGYTNSQIIQIFGNHPFIVNTLDKEPQTTQEEALIEFSRRTKPGEIPSAEDSKNYINVLFFTHQYYNLAKCGRYKVNKKLNLADRITRMMAAEDIYIGKQLMVAKGQFITRDNAVKIQNAGINSVEVLHDNKISRVIGNNRVDLTAHINCNPEDYGITELVHWPVLQEILKNNKTKEERLAAVKENALKLENFQITLDDIIATINYHLNLIDGFGKLDVRDHLANRRVASCGELLAAEFRKGMTKLQVQVRETLQSRDLTGATPSNVLNARHINKALKEFMATSQLSLLMEQTNPICSLTHKRRLSAVGPGGVKKERATAEVRDINHTHYGRICVIETPEGQSIGLITSMASYARINEYGFLETPYRVVDPITHKVTDEVVYLMADEDDDKNIAQATEPLNEDGSFVHPRVVCRHGEIIREFDVNMVDYIDVTPRQLISIGTCLIPFVENDATNRALMGANMQRQAVPLLRTESPIVGTGFEYKIAKDSGALVLAEGDGVVKYVSSDCIIVEYKDGKVVEYRLKKFLKTNAKTCYNQKPICKKGEKVHKGDILADGPATDNGELALGKNITVAFMNWEGYNFEDAIIVSERLVKNDAFTSIDIVTEDCKARSTKLGDEEITRDIAGVGEEALKNLDERGIVRIGTEVDVGDILVGKVTPKGETELTPEERLLKAIFGEKTKEVRNTSLKVKHGGEGVVVSVEVLSRKNKDDLEPGVNMMVRVFIAQKRRLQIGDKLAGRHGNKGVVSIVLPESDMPYMENGQSVDMILNPLGVPSRMNVGQIMEMHLGLVAKTLDWKVATPSLDSATEEEIVQLLKDNNLPEDGTMQLYDGRSGEAFENKCNVGVMYMLKLVHMVETKIHARSIGTYSLITQQPLNGKAQFGGQRFGEMEVWALEAYGASKLLQEMLTVKSDDVEGRKKTYEAIVKGQPIPDPGMPESFKVLIKEMQGLGLDIKIMTADRRQLAINEVSDEEVEISEMKSVNRKGLDDITLEFDQLQEDYQKEISESFDESALFDDIDD